MMKEYDSYGDYALRVMEDIERDIRKNLTQMEIETLKKRILSLKDHLHELEAMLARKEDEQKKREKRQNPV